jgi:8-oxo-dGTP pyrophosphatase MutT (NUDIX family)
MHAEHNTADAGLDALDMDEFRDLVADYGDAPIQRIVLDIDQDLYANRMSKAADRRGEVVFAVQGPHGGTWVHRKSFYEYGLFRLPSGGINPDEKVVDALHRELREETGLTIQAAHFVGVQDCWMQYNDRSVRFVSYVFHVDRTSGELRAGREEDITEFVEVQPEGLANIAARLRHVPPPYNGWGRWRALAHDLVYAHVLGHKT